MLVNIFIKPTLFEAVFNSTHSLQKIFSLQLSTPCHTLPPNTRAHPPEIITQHYPRGQNGLQNSNMCSDTNNNIQHKTSLLDSLKGRPPPGFPRTGEQRRGCRMQESRNIPEKKKSSSFTGTIQLGGGNTPETLVIASTCLKSLLVGKL